MKKKFKVFFLLGLSIVFNQAVFSKVIDLDTFNPDQCRQQLLHSVDSFPIVLTYFPECPYAKKFMPIYEAVAKEHPERTFFRYNFNENAVSNQNLAICLQQLGGAFSPVMRVIPIYRDGSTGTSYLFPALKIGGNGNWTKDQVVNFIDINDEKRFISMSNSQK